MISSSRCSAGVRAGEQFSQDTVDRQVGIAADGRSEVAIAIAGQGIVAFFLRAIGRPHERTQHGEMDRPLLGPTDDCVQELLQLEAAAQVSNLNAEFLDEFAEGLDLGRAGRLVDASQKGELLGVNRLGDGLVGRQHEFLDDLMALGVLRHVGAGDAARGVEVHLDLGHVQLQGAALQPPLAQDHGQRVHVAQQRVNLGPQLSPPRLRVGQKGIDLLVGQPLAAANGGRVIIDRHPHALPE